MISEINITVNAAKPKFPLPPMVAFNGSPSSVRISGVPCSIGNWSINNVRVLVSYPNNFTVEKTAVKVDNFWIATIDGSQTNGVIKNGFQVIADGVDENNLPVSGYVLGVGDVVVVPRDKGIEKLVDRYAVRYLNEPPTTPSIGDMLNLNGQFKVWDGSKWVSVSGDDVEVYDSEITLQANGVEFDSFTLNASEAKTIDIPVPSKTSELDNDSGFITSAAIPSKVSELDNDTGYITSSAIPSTVGAFENDVGYLTSVSWGEVQDKPDVALMSDIPSKVSELDNDAGYITMSAIPAIPSKTSDLDNDSGFITLSAIPSNVGAFTNDVGYVTAEAIPSTVSSFENDAGYITASDVVPYTLTASASYYGYAKNAMDAGQLMNYNTKKYPPDYDETSKLLLEIGTPRVAKKTFAPWSLSYYNGTTFEPPYELVFDNKDYVSFWDGRRL